MLPESDHPNPAPEPGPDPTEQPVEAYAAAAQPPAPEPEFVPSPATPVGDDIRSDQSGIAPPAGAPGPANPPRRDEPRAETKPAPKARDAQGMSSGTRAVANLMLIALGAGIMAGGFALGRLYAPPRPPGETADKPPADMAKTDDVKKNTDQVEKLKADFDNLNKQMSSKPDYGPELANMRNQMTALSGTITDFPARLDSVNQKLETLSKTQLNQSGDSNGSSTVDLAKRISDLSQVVDSLRVQQGARPAAGGINREINVEGQAMEQAVDFYKNKKYNEARDAFRKLQTAYPDDARVWYYSALSNGFATGDWTNETARLVTVGIEREKAGTPDPARIDALFSGLTAATGKDWLAGYRQRVRSN